MTDTTPDPLVRLERREDRVAVLTLANGKLNPLSVAVLGEIEAHAQALAAEPTGTIGAVVITGNERAFAAGANIVEFTAGQGEEFAIAAPEEIRRVGGAFLRALNAVAALPMPVIAAVRGFALGGGCELALACDLRVAGEGATLGQPEILLGIIPGGGGTQRLARLVGPARAKDLILTGRNVGSEEAARIGLVDRVVPDAEVLTAALELASRLAAGADHAIALAKACIDRGLEGTLADGLRLEQDLFVDSFGRPDAAVGVRSFLENGPGRARFH